MSTLGRYHGYMGDTMSTSGGYEYIGRCSVHQGMFRTSGDIMMHVGEQVGKNLSISIRGLHRGFQ